MHDFATAARKGWPYSEKEVPLVLLSTLVRLGLTCSQNGRPYTMQSNIRNLVAGFLERCKLKDVPLRWKGGRKLGMQRWLKSRSG